MSDRLAQSQPEEHARAIVEDMALTLQAAIVARHAPPAIADAFCAMRLAEQPAFAYGASRAEIDADAILSRAMPVL
jgi:putative acyl-CoA dehydrogenase